ncbi:MAG: lipid II flippase MurJ [Candidatus Latescibacteria bacterium]|nr:lipid II flippase MurJ [Candidatus Latescibacterota bacterium]
MIKKARTFLTRWLFEGEVLRLMGLTVLAKPIGLYTQVLIAKHFGAGTEYDAYLLAIFLATLMSQMIARVYGSVVVPFLIDLKSRTAAEEYFRVQMALNLLYSAPAVVFMLLVMVFGDFFVRLIAPNAPPETTALAVRALPMLAVPALALMGLEMGKVILNLNKRYRVAATMPIVNSLILVGSVLLFQERWGIWSLFGGYAAAQVLQFAITWGQAKSLDFTRICRPAISKAQVAQVWSLSWMVFIATSLEMANSFLEKYFAAGLAVGSVSAIGYALVIMNFAVQIFTFSLIAMMFTRMSELIAARDMTAVGTYLENNLRRLTRFVMPLSIGLTVASLQIVQVLFERGQFDHTDTLLTSRTLALYMVGLPAVVINHVVARIFFSLNRMRDKVWLALQYVATATLGNLLLIPSLQVAGIAVSATLSINLHIGLGLWILSRNRNGIQTGGFIWVILRAYTISAIVYALFYLAGLGALTERLITGDSHRQMFLLGLVRVALVFGLYFACEALARFLKLRRARLATG